MRVVAFGSATAAERARLNSGPLAGCRRQVLDHVDRVSSPLARRVGHRACIRAPSRMPICYDESSSNGRDVKRDPA